MKRTAPVILLAILLAFLATPFIRAEVPATQPAALTPGVHAIASLKLTWNDAARKRDVPAKIYYPTNLATGKTAPIIIFSHGLGGSREGYSYLGEHWAKHGYIVAHLQHLGSDDAVWRGADKPAQVMPAMRRAAADPQNILNRPRDVSFAIDQLLRLNDDEKSPLHARINPHRIAVAGHSFGAYTTLAAAGLSLPPSTLNLADKRITAAIPLSSPASNRRPNFGEAYATITVPCLHMTGTLDTSPIGDTSAKDRRIPYDNSNHSDQYLITFIDGNHMLFSGPTARRTPSPADVVNHALIQLASTAFLDAYLRNDPAALAWLTANTGLKKTLEAHATFEFKTP